MGTSGRLACCAGLEGAILCGGADGIVRKWSVGSGALPIASFDCGAPIGAMAVGLSGAVIAAALGSGVSDDSDVRTVEGTVLFLDAKTMEGKGKAQKGPDSGYPTCAVFGSGDVVYVGTSKGEVQAFDASTFTYKSTICTLPSAVVTIDVSEGGLVAAGGAKGETGYFDEKGAEKSPDNETWSNGTFAYDLKYLGVSGVSAVCGGLVGAEGGAVTVSAGNVTAHGGKVEGVGKCGELGFWTFSGADNGAFYWGKR